MIKLLDCPYENKLNEIFQSNELKFAFVDKTDEEGTYLCLMPFIKCREYFNELLMVNHHPDDFSFDDVHGFKYQPKYKLNLEQTTMAVKFPNKNTAAKFMENLKHLNNVEEANSLDELTTVEQTNKTNVYLIKASKFWIQKCILLNIYTLLIKLLVLDYPTKSIQAIKDEWMKNNYNLPTEIGYIERVTDTRFTQILSNLTPIANFETKYVDGSNEKRDPYSVHALSGIVTVFCYTTKQIPNLKDFVEFLTTTYPKKAA